ncbi:MAG: Ribosomal RNA large subunit methyltransferase K/L [bacterium]|nr:Ribosomal RNA large subunit methyltransferase K/L [bacterium]
MAVQEIATRVSSAITAMLGKRQKLFERCTAFRLCHYELEPHLTIDYYSGYLLCTYYENFPPARLSEIVPAFVHGLQQAGLPFRGAVKKFRPENLSHIADDKRAEIYQPVALLGELPPPRFIINEYNLQFVVSFHEGHSTGLFLDIKPARQLVQEIVRPGQEVLNLFSYTGGFSIAAAKAGASRVIEVDTAGKWLRWSQENQRLNQVTVVRQRREEAGPFLHKQKDAAFDFIICDPPTYSTQKSGARFIVEKSYAAMLDDFSRVLRPPGYLLACTNYRDWPKKKFFQLFANRFQLEQDVPISEDFAGDDYLKVGLFKKRLAG